MRRADRKGGKKKRGRKLGFQKQVVPGTPAAAMASLLNSFDQSQWWGRQKIAEYQFNMVRKLVSHAVRSVPFYQQRFVEAGLDADQINPDSWSSVPILTRTDLQTNNILSNQIPKGHGRIGISQTSGSTGEPVQITSTDHAQFFWMAFTIREHLWHQRKLTGRSAAIRYSPGVSVPKDGAYSSNWGPALAMLYKTGPGMMFSINTDINRQLDWLAVCNPHYLLTYPSNLQALIEQSRRRGIVLPDLKEARTIGEMVKPGLRDLCREAWGVPLTDIYSSQEIGYIALQCPNHKHYHIQAENVLVEILDKQGRACLPGEIGRLVVTALHNYATPLIRYEIKDYAEAGPACSCGRGLPVINRIVGRQRNILILPSGEQRWPIFGFSRFSEVAPIRQFQFIQHSLEHIEMKLVAERELTVFDQNSLSAIIQESMGYPFKITFTPLPVIPQGPNGKFEEFISLVGVTTQGNPQSVSRKTNNVKENSHEFKQQE